MIVPERPPGRPTPAGHPRGHLGSGGQPCRHRSCADSSTGYQCSGVTYWEAVRPYIRLRSRRGPTHGPRWRGEARRSRHPSRPRDEQRRSLAGREPPRGLLQCAPTLDQDPGCSAGSRERQSCRLRCAGCPRQSDPVDGQPLPPLEPRDRSTRLTPPVRRGPIILRPTPIPVRRTPVSLELMCQGRRSASLLHHQIGDVADGLESHTSRPWAPPVLRVAHKSTGTQILQRVSCFDTGQASDTSSTHCHDDLSSRTDVVKVAAELVVQLSHTDLGLRLPVR